MELNKLIDRYIAGLQRDFDSQGLTHVKRGFAAEEGRKYIKIVDGYVQDNGNLNHVAWLLLLKKQQVTSTNQQVGTHQQRVLDTT